MSLFPTEINITVPVVHDILNMGEMENKKTSIIKNLNPIRISFNGVTSTGKSTAIKAIWGQDLSTTKDEKTTSGTHVYRIKNKDKYSDPKHEEFIKNKTDEINKNIIEKIKKGIPLVYDDLKEIVHPMGKPFEIMYDQVKVEVSDSQGMDDPRSKDIYHQIIEDEFYKSHILVYLFDIKRVLISDDEEKAFLHMLGLLRLHVKLYNVHKKLIVCLNKCDDMISKEDDELEIVTSVTKELYNNAEIRLRKIIEKEVPGLEFYITPISFEDAYIFRTLKKNNSLEFDENSLNRLGCHLVGNHSWLSQSPDEKKKTVIKELSKAKEEDKFLFRIKSSGFIKFKNILESLMTKNHRYQYFVNNIMYNVHKTVSEFVKHKVYDITDHLEQVIRQKHILMELNTEFSKTDTKEVDNIIENLIKMYVTFIAEILESEVYSKDMTSIRNVIFKCLIIIKDKFPSIYGDGYSEICDLLQSRINTYYILSINPQQTCTLSDIKYSLSMLNENKYSDLDSLTNKTFNSLHNYLDAWTHSSEYVLDFFKSMKIILGITTKNMISYISSYLGHKYRFESNLLNDSKTTGMEYKTTLSKLISVKKYFDSIVFSGKIGEYDNIYLLKLKVNCIIYKSKIDEIDEIISSDILVEEYLISLMNDSSSADLYYSLESDLSLISSDAITRFAEQNKFVREIIKSEDPL